MVTNGVQNTRSDFIDEMIAAILAMPEPLVEPLEDVLLAMVRFFAARNAWEATQKEATGDA